MSARGPMSPALRDLAEGSGCEAWIEDGWQKGILRAERGMAGDKALIRFYVERGDLDKLIPPAPGHDQTVSVSFVDGAVHEVGKMKPDGHVYAQILTVLPQRLESLVADTPYETWARDAWANGRLRVAEWPQTGEIRLTRVDGLGRPTGDGEPAELTFAAGPDGGLRRIAYREHGTLHRDDGPALVTLHPNGEVATASWIRGGEYVVDGSPNRITLNQDGDVSVVERLTGPWGQAWLRCEDGPAAVTYAEGENPLAHPQCVEYYGRLPEHGAPNQTIAFRADFAPLTGSPAEVERARADAEVVFDAATAKIEPLRDELKEHLAAKLT